MSSLLNHSPKLRSNPTRGEEKSKVYAEGILNGQFLHKLMVEDKDNTIQTAWCRPSGGGKWGNPARSQQLRQMLDRHLATRYPKKEGQLRTDLRTRVSWSGEVDEGIVRFTVSKRHQTDLDQLQKLFKVFL